MPTAIYIYIYTSVNPCIYMHEVKGNRVKWSRVQWSRGSLLEQFLWEVFSIFLELSRCSRVFSVDSSFLRWSRAFSCFLEFPRAKWARLARALSFLELSRGLEFSRVVSGVIDCFKSARVCSSVLELSRFYLVFSVFPSFLEPSGLGWLERSVFLNFLIPLEFSQV